MPRRLGQHFLVRTALAERIARAVPPACQPVAPLVVEIGPGRGALTERLLECAARVVAVEIDPALAAHLARRFPAQPRLEIVLADVLSTDLGQWGPCVIAGNLPYYITSPILERIFARAGTVSRAVLMMQKEVALRLVASPGTRDYGYLSVLAQVEARPRLLFSVPPAAFQPAPKVDSAVVALDLDPPTPGRDALLRFAALAFRHKRKTLRNNLSAHYPAIQAQPEANLRAEQLTVGQLRALLLRLEERSA